jgi:hypothetical protein
MAEEFSEALISAHHWVAVGATAVVVALAVFMH